MAPAFLALLVGAGQCEDRLAVLDADDAARGKALAIADAVDLVDDRDRRIAGPQEIAVQRVDMAVAVDRAGCRDQGLADDEAAEDALPADLRARAAVEIV